MLRRLPRRCGVDLLFLVLFFLLLSPQGCTATAAPESSAAGTPSPRRPEIPAGTGSTPAPAAGTSSTPPSPAGTGAPARSTLGFIVPDAEHVRTAQYRCQGRPLGAKEPSLEKAMERIVGMAAALGSSRSWRPVFIGLRACGSYRSLFVGNNLTSEKLIYDERGSLVATLETSDVVDLDCGRTPSEATVHRGQHVDCMETELLYPRP